MKKLGVFLFYLILVSLFSVSVMANELADETKIFYDADVNFNLLETYNAGDVIEGTITVDNQEDVPIVDGFLIVEVVNGCIEPTYPSQYSDCDNIFEEIIIDKVNVPAKSTIDVPFSYVLDSDLSSGMYRMDLAFRTKKTPVIGMPHILLIQNYQYFELTSSGNFPYAKILRTKTNIGEQTGPIGVGRNPGEDFILEVFVESAEARSATLEVSICEWQDSICDVVSTKTQNLNLEVGEQSIPIGLTAPSSPDAYAIRIELKDSNGLVSLYRSRVVVHGPMAKVRKLSTDNYYYNNEKMNVNVLVAGSPDHYTRPVVEDIFLTVTVTDLVGDKVVGTKTKVIGDLDADNLFAEATLSFGVSGNLYEFETCAKLTNSGTDELYEEYCYITNANNFPSLIHDVELTESFDGDNFNGKVCVYDAITGSAISSDLFVSVKLGTSGIFQERKIVDNCLELSFDIEQGKNYDVLVQDIATQQDFNFNIIPEESLLGVSKSIWLYAILTGVAIIAITLAIILPLARRNKMRGAQ